MRRAVSWECRKEKKKTTRTWHLTLKRKRQRACLGINGMRLGFSFTLFEKGELTWCKKILMPVPSYSTQYLPWAPLDCLQKGHTHPNLSSSWLPWPHCCGLKREPYNGFPCKTQAQAVNTLPRNLYKSWAIKSTALTCRKSQAERAKFL